MGSHTGRSPRRRRATTADEVELVRRLAALMDTFLATRRRDRLPEVLVGLAADLLRIEGAALSLLGPEGTLAVAAYTGQDAGHLEDLQVTAGSSPVHEAVSSADAVLLDVAGPSRTRSDRFSSLAGQVARAGLGYVYAVPVRRRREALGSLTLYGRQSTDLSAPERELAQTLGDIAVIGLLQRRAVRAADVQVSQLEQALVTRVVIEQAKGVLVASGERDLDGAFATLRRSARNRHQRLEEVARDVVGRALAAEPPPALPRQHVVVEEESPPGGGRPRRGDR